MKTYNDVFHRDYNRIPFCFNDAQKIIKDSIKEDGIVVGRTVFMAISDYAQMFMSQVISR